MSSAPLRDEPNFETACKWWPDIRNTWTPIGWKNHLFRFNVFFNGMILAKPDLNRRTTNWKDQGVQLAFIPYIEGEFKYMAFHTRDDGLVKQGWCGGPAPRLWSEWSDNGVLLRQEVFGHIPGGKSIVSGDESLFAWVRLSIHDICPGLPLEPKHGFIIKVSKPHIKPRMNYAHNLHFNFADSPYPRPLAADPNGHCPANGWRLSEADGRVRLAVAPAQKCEIKIYHGDEFEPSSERVFSPAAKEDLFVHVLMDCSVGTHVDLLVPMLPTPREVFDREAALGYETALKEADGYWSQTPATAASIQTPEPLVNEMIRHSVKSAEVIAERNPADGLLTLLTGSFQYANLGPTPNAMELIMLLDTMGYHEAVDKYLECFRLEQGKVVAPSPALKQHPGYLSAPKSLAAIDWLTDHGAMLYAVCEHALLSGNREFAARWTDGILKACHFIKYARSAPHDGSPGLLPPAVATDRGTTIQAIWSDGWNYKGLTAAVRFLKQISHPAAAEFEAEARDYRQTFIKAIRQKTREKPAWKDDQGRLHHFVPTSLSNDKREESRHAFYLDGGPLFLVFSGLLDADDELMESTRLWFREGPQTKMFRDESCCWQVPALRHEMSSCEPCYSWNIFHSHQLGDRYRYLEGMYSLFAGGISRQTYTSCETRGGVCGTVFTATLAAYLARLAVIDDQVNEEELHLLRIFPLAWLSRERETIFDNIPTAFGPLTLRFSLNANATQLSVTCRARFRSAPKRILIHTPPLAGLQSIVINGKPHTAGKAPIELNALPER